MFWNNWKDSLSRKSADSRKSNLRFEALEERQLLTAVGLDAPEVGSDDLVAEYAAPLANSAPIEIPVLAAANASPGVEIVGTAEVGLTVKAEVEGIKESSGYAFQWFRVKADGEVKAIPDSNKNEYSITFDDYGCQLKVKVAVSVTDIRSSEPVQVAEDITIITKDLDQAADDLNKAVSIINEGHSIYFTSPEDVGKAKGADQTIVVDQTLTVKRAMNIVGRNKAGVDSNIVLSGNDASRIFTVNSTVKEDSTGLNLKDLTLANAYVSGSGAAINNNGKVVLEDVVVKDGKATSYGAAVYNNYIGTLTIKGETEFTGNQAKYGGAIYNAGGTITINSATFSENSASDYGGAIYNVNKTVSKETYTGTISVEGYDVVSGEGEEAQTTQYAGSVVFTNNGSNETTTTKRGGALYSSGSFTVAKGASADFGVINKKWGLFVVSEGNAAEIGGAVYNTSTGTFTVNGALSMAGNKATTNGGAIANYGAVAINSEGANFEANKATTNGGAYYGYGNLTIAEGASATFLGNEAEGSGGAIYAVKSSDYTSGLTIDGSADFEFNKATKNGGALYVGQNVQFDVNGDVTAYGNEAEGNGGAIANNGTTTIAKDATLTLKVNTATAKGGALYSFAGAKFNVDGELYATYNKAANGGAIYSDNLNPSGVEQKKGAAISVNGTADFGQNSANEGGAIYNAAKANLYVNAGGELKANENGYELIELPLLGSAYGGFGRELKTDSMGNKVQYAEKGGAIANYGVAKIDAKAVVSGTTISTDEETGVKTTTYSYRQSFGKVTLDINVATEQGGAIYNASGATCAVYGVLKVGGNKSSDGAGVANAGTFTLAKRVDKVVSKETETPPEVEGQKPAVTYEYANFTVVSSTTAKGNEAKNDGGFLYNAEGGVFKVEANLTAFKNYAKNGAVFANDSKSFMIASDKDSQKIYSNEATDKGGVLYNAADATCSVEGTAQFGLFPCPGQDDMSNSAKDGGLIANDGALTITKDGALSLLDGKATQGGALYNGSSATFTVDGVFDACYGEANQGGAVYNVGGTVTFNATSRVMLYGNEAKFDEQNVNGSGDGGALYNLGGLTVAGEILADKNTAVKGGFLANYGTAVFAAREKTEGEEEKPDYSFKGNKLKQAEYQVDGATKYVLAEGGVVYNSQGGNLTFNGSVSGADNEANNGGFLANYGTVDFNANVTFEGNKANDVSETVKVQIVVEEFNFDVDEEKVVYEGRGGAVYSGNGARTNFNDMTLTAAENEATYGGVLANYGKSVIFNQGTTIDVTLNKANEEGGVFYNGQVEYQMQDGEVAFLGQKADENGKYLSTITIAGTLNAGTENTDEANAAKSGGVVSNYGQFSFVEGSVATFQNNKAQEFGGAILNFVGGRFDVEGEFSLIGNTVASNEEDPNAGHGSGGAIANDGDMYLSTKAVEKEKFIVFDGNVAVSRGGAYYGFGNLYVDGDVEFTDNTIVGGGAEATVEEEEPVQEGYGGAISVLSFGTIHGYVEITGDVLFSGNSASMSGGAVSVEDSGKVVIGSDVLFTENEADNGGAVYVWTKGVFETQAGTVFSLNTAYANGGAIDIEKNGVVNIKGLSSTETALFSENSAGVSGGAIYTDASLTINAGQFTDNKADVSGGAISVGFAGDVTIKQAAEKDGTERIFVRNHASIGGVVANSGKLSVEGVLFGGEDEEVEFEGETTTVVKSNYATFQGGVIYNAGDATIKDSQFVNNYVTGEEEGVGGYGGAIANGEGFPYDTSLTLENTEFKKNYATNGYGGALANYDKVTVKVVGNLTMEENSAAYGGAIANVAEAGKIVFDAASVSTITGNTASDQGGAIYNYSEKSQKTTAITIDGTATITGNNAKNDGGVVYNENATLTIAGKPTIKANTAIEGGAVYNDKNGVATVSATEAVISNNGSTESEAGAIKNLGSFTVSGKLTMEGNKANDQGAAFDNEGTLTFSSKSEVTLKANVLNNATSAESKGAAVCNSGNFYSYGKLSISGHKATNGAAVYNAGTTRLGYNANKSQYEKVDLTIENNEATGYAGAVYNAIGATLYAKGKLTVTGNSAANGGAFYNAGTATVYGTTGSDISENYATKNGGAVYNVAAKTFKFYGEFGLSNNGKWTETVTDPETSEESTVDKNTELGGAIYNAGKVYLYTNNTNNGSTFEANKANEGGFLYNVKGGYLYVYGGFNAKNNEATDKGGAISNYGYTYFKTASGYTLAPKFEGNTAANKGGAVYTSTTSTNACQLSGTFNNNTVTAENGEGGALYVANRTTLVEKVEMSGNTAYNGAGVSNHGTLTINTTEGSSISGKATNFGGAIYNAASKTTTVSGKIELADSEAFQGGGLYNAAGAKVNVTTGDLSLTNDKAINKTVDEQVLIGQGAAIYNADKATVTVTGSKTIEEIDGKEVVTYKGSLNAKNNVNATYGAIYNAGKFTVGENGEATFSNNTGVYAGAVYNVKGAELTIDGMIKAASNEATGQNAGGAITNNYGTVAIDSSRLSTFKSNTALEGGAIYNVTSRIDVTKTWNETTEEYDYTETAYNAGSLTIAGAIFMNNKATGENGGAVYNQGAMSVENVKFENNTAAAKGGAIYHTAGAEDYGTL